METNVKIRLTEEELCEVIGEVLETLGYKKSRMLETDVLRGFLCNAIISEGLIKTFSYIDTRKALLALDLPKYGIRVMKMPTFRMSNKNNEKPIQIYLTFSNGLEGISKEYCDALFHRLDVCGWYFASVLGIGKEFDYDKLKAMSKSFVCIFEPKFDVLLSDDDMPQKLYHIMPKRLVDKVLKKGLVPKSGSMFTNHPERVYLFMQDPSDMGSEIASTFNFGKNIEEEYVLLEIDYDYIRNGCKFYIDPNSNSINACFTLEPIPPFAIKVKGNV